MDIQPKHVEYLYWYMYQSGYIIRPTIRGHANVHAGRDGPATTPPIPCRTPGYQYNNVDAGQSGWFHAAPRASRWRGTPPIRISGWGSPWSQEGKIPDLPGDAGEECPPPGAESQ